MAARSHTIAGRGGGSWLWASHLVDIAGSQHTGGRRGHMASWRIVQAACFVENPVAHITRSHFVGGLVLGVTSRSAKAPNRSSHCPSTHTNTPLVGYIGYSGDALVDSRILPDRKWRIVISSQ